MNLTRTDLKRLYPDFMLLLSKRTESVLERDARTTQSDTARELLAIRAAIARIREGLYGICDECDEVIPLSRLTTSPTTPYCLACQRELEARHSQSHSRRRVG